MTNLNSELTFEEAKELFGSVGMQYLDNAHNRKMMKSVIDAQLANLRKAKN